MVRHKAELGLFVAVGAFALTGAFALFLNGLAGWSDEPPPPPALVEPAPPVAAQAPDDPWAWFDGVRRYCNPVDVRTALQRMPAPATPEGAMREAACWALAGRMQEARALIDRLPAQLRVPAAGLVFEVGHPAADAGDEIAAGPLMELVVEYWPNHYMALYHAGASRFEQGSHDRAKFYLERFMTEYPPEDGWRASARSMLAEIEATAR